MKLWVARNKQGTLEMYKNKPSLAKLTNEPVWINGDFVAFLFKDLFPEVTFENSPRQVELNYVMNGL